ncbi:MAG: LPS assembly protein LptD, partial [Proteobacteria bacterium]|nr:LPS assembly protein LptD [Pseudomonadota bacterium]
KVGQSYDILEGQKNRDVDKSPYSDVFGDLILYPNDYLAFRQKVNFNTDDNTFSSYSTEAQVEDKRGDRIRGRVTYNETQFRQLESNIEVAVTDRVKLGYYSRYDDEKGQMIESKAGLRYLSSCNCYIFDIDFTDRINPDDRSITFNITLNGLGELTQKFFPTFLDDKTKTK